MTRSWLIMVLLACTFSLGLLFALALANAAGGTTPLSMPVRDPFDVELEALLDAEANQ
jgi:hypothetical protein